MSPFSVYDLRRNWRKFRPHLDNPRVQLIEQLAMSAICPEYTVGVHIPREAGRCLDYPWPRSRKGATAYQCFGFCHAIAPVMLELAKLAEPNLEWVISGHERHTVVTTVRDSQLVILDVNAIGAPPELVVDQFVRDVRQPSIHDMDSAAFKDTSDTLVYINDTLRGGAEFQFRSDSPMGGMTRPLAPGARGFYPLPIRGVAHSDSAFRYAGDPTRVELLVVYGEHVMLQWTNGTVSTVAVSAFLDELTVQDEAPDDAVLVGNPDRPLIVNHGLTIMFGDMEIPATRLHELSHTFHYHQHISPEDAGE